jgi:hypothetical protein
MPTTFYDGLRLYRPPAVTVAVVIVAEAEINKVVLLLVGIGEREHLGERRDRLTFL